MTVGGAPRGAPSAVLLVHHGLDWITGSERCLLDLVATLDRARFSPVVLCDAPALADAARALDVPVHLTADWTLGTEGLLASRERVREVAALVRRHGIRLIHANDAEPIKALVPVARANRIPVVAQLHNLLDADERRWSWLHQVSRAVGVSEVTVRGLRDDGMPAGAIEVIHNGVDPARLSRGNARGLRAELGVPSDAVVFTVAASLIPRKGIEVALRGFALLHRRHPAARLLLCGDGPLEGDLRALTAAQGIDRHVHFLGRRDDLGAILRDATDVLVSAAWAETFGLTLVEAGVFGIPTITSAIEAHVEVTAGRTGVLFPPGDEAALAAAMESLVTDPALRQRLGESGRARAESEFLVGRYVARFEATYATLLARPRADFGWIRGTRWPPVYRRWIGDAVRRRAARLSSPFASSS